MIDSPPPPHLLSTDTTVETAAVIEDFLARASDPAVFEPGYDQIRVSPGAWSVELRAGRPVLQAWDEARNLCRRVSAIRAQKPGSLELVIERFGGREGQLFVLDLAVLRRPETERRGRRLVFREIIRRCLRRQFPGWTIAELSTERYLEASLGDTSARAFLRTGTLGWAALAARDEPRSVSAALTSGLIWLDYLRLREPRITIGGLALFLPENHERATCLRLRWMNPKAARFDLFVYSPDGIEEPVDPAAYTNLNTKLELRPHAAFVEPATPEGAIEACLRVNPAAIEADFLPAPVYSQVIGSAGADCGIADLLAVDTSGRLAVLELKASEDPHLPIQALDYWIRTNWHLERGEFEQNGYFPGIALRRAPPRLYLVAPALRFHATTESVLRYFDPAVEVVRVGLKPLAPGEWRQGPKIMFRIRGARRPL